MSFIHHAYLIERKIESTFRDLYTTGFSETQVFRPILGWPTAMTLEPLFVASCNVDYYL